MATDPVFAGPHATTIALVVGAIRRDSEGIDLLITSMTPEESRIALWALAYLSAECIQGISPGSEEHTVERLRRIIVGLRAVES
ncbi:hypothetical protein ABZ345_34090 [Lentzea sp. NPDC005914]|uniref:hypothetical protein n=1 Tax=Lentzea sp. NPDC005914 TaxID=3154572 RepID=UPI0033EC218D